MFPLLVRAPVMIFLIDWVCSIYIDSALIRFYVLGRNYIQIASVNKSFSSVWHSLLWCSSNTWREVISLLNLIINKFNEIDCNWISCTGSALSTIARNCLCYSCLKHTASICYLEETSSFRHSSYIYSFLFTCVI